MCCNTRKKARNVVSKIGLRPYSNRNPVDLFTTSWYIYNTLAHPRKKGYISFSLISTCSFDFQYLKQDFCAPQIRTVSIDNISSSYHTALLFHLIHEFTLCFNHPTSLSESSLVCGYNLTLTTLGTCRCLLLSAISVASSFIWLSLTDHQGQEYRNNLDILLTWLPTKSHHSRARHS